MLITDHINLTGMSPLTGHNDPRLGTRFPDMSQAYDADACQAFRDAAISQSVSLKAGVYAGLKGPSYETPAEIRMLGVIGAHAVGMSTVCEVIAARHMGVRVAGHFLHHKLCCRAVRGHPEPCRGQGDCRPSAGRLCRAAQ